MDFLEYLESSGKIDEQQRKEILNQSKNSHEKAGQLILKKNLLPKNELLQHLQCFIEASFSHQ